MRNPDVTGVTFRTAKRSDGTTYDVARVFIAGMAFQTDLMGEAMERQLRRLSDANGFDVLDTRKGAS